MSSLINKGTNFKPKHPKAADSHGRRGRSRAGVQKKTHEKNARKRQNKKAGDEKNERLKDIFAFNAHTLVPWNLVTWEHVFECAKQRGDWLYKTFDDFCIKDENSEMRRTSYLYDHTRDNNSWMANKIITYLGLDPYFTFNKWHPNYRFHQLRILQKLRKRENLSQIDMLLLAAGVENASSKHYNAQFFYINVLSTLPPEQWPPRMTKEQRAKFRAFELQMEVAWRNRHYQKQGKVDEAKLEEGMRFMFPEMFADSPLKDDVLAKARPLYLERTRANGASMTAVPEMSDSYFDAVINEFVIWSTGGGKQLNAEGFIQLSGLSENVELDLGNIDFDVGDKSMEDGSISVEVDEDDDVISKVDIEDKLKDMVLIFPRAMNLVKTAKELSKSYDIMTAFDSDTPKEYEKAPSPQRQNLALSFANLQDRSKKAGPKKSAFEGFLESYKPLSDNSGTGRK